jgi:F0F1-type ATP synthase assembly protein I
MQQEDQENFQKDKKALNDYGRYTGLAFQMLAVIGVFTFIGYKLDRWLELSYPIFTIVLIFLSVIASLYSIIRGLK